jgi:hypothetical protein
VDFPIWNDTVKKRFPELYNIPYFKVKAMKAIFDEIKIKKKVLGYREQETDLFMKSTKNALQAGLNPELIQIRNDDGNIIFRCGFPNCLFQSAYKVTTQRHMQNYHSPIVFVYFNIMTAPLPIISCVLHLFNDSDLKYVTPIHVNEIDFEYICPYSLVSNHISPLKLLAISSNRKNFVEWLNNNFEKCKNIEFKTEVLRNREMWLTEESCDSYKSWQTIIKESRSTYVVGFADTISSAMKIDIPNKIKKLKLPEPKIETRQEIDLYTTLKQAKIIVKKYRENVK